MRPQWVEIEPNTWAMNVPGGCIIRFGGLHGSSMTFAHGISIEYLPREKGGGIGFVSTVADDMTKALGPLQDLIRMFKGVPGVPNLPDPV